MHDCLAGGASTVLARLSETLLLLGRPEQARPWQPLAPLAAEARLGLDTAVAHS